MLVLNAHFGSPRFRHIRMLPVEVKGVPSTEYDPEETKSEPLTPPPAHMESWSPETDPDFADRYDND